MVVIDMHGLDEPLVVVLGLFVALLLLSRPATVRALVRLAQRFGDWAAKRRERMQRRDLDEDELWQMERRRRLCADLRRVEHLLATDTWMSATRQRGNRIAYARLVDDLRHTPEVFPAIQQPQTVSLWAESMIDHRSDALINNGFPQQPRTVEVLEIGWRRRRN